MAPALVPQFLLLGLLSPLAIDTHSAAHGQRGGPQWRISGHNLPNAQLNISRFTGFLLLVHVRAFSLKQVGFVWGPEKTSEFLDDPPMTAVFPFYGGGYSEVRWFWCRCSISR
ncbi:unnamed protein product [Tuber aestivum]|uniref:Uncharacterized protein n=1 Tax=Tuber aestivum TaxID=59557 RepID=A0A292PI42_9PEZI|nr:unnamed protein product [Tuber aestivum]